MTERASLAAIGPAVGGVESVAEVRRSRAAHGGAAGDDPAAAEPEAVRAALADAPARPEADRTQPAVAAVVARARLESLDGWARLGQLARDDIEAYAAFRVGYHRGPRHASAERLAGRPGTCAGATSPTAAFLRALARAGADRGPDRRDRTRPSGCAQFLRQLDPSWPPDDVD